MEFERKILLYEIRFVGEEDIAWFEKTVRRLGEEELGANLGSYAHKMSYFVDFLRCFSKTILTEFAPLSTHCTCTGFGCVQRVCFSFTGSLKLMIIDGFLKQSNVLPKKN